MQYMQIGFIPSPKQFVFGVATGLAGIGIHED